MCTKNHPAFVVVPITGLGFHFDFDRFLWDTGFHLLVCILLLFPLRGLEGRDCLSPLQGLAQLDHLDNLVAGRGGEGPGLVGPDDALDRLRGEIRQKHHDFLVVRP